MREAFHIAGVDVAAGSRQLIDLQMPRLASHTSLSMPVHVIHGKRSGPVLFISAAIHGDELNGVEIIRRVLSMKTVSRLRGTLIAVPVVNIYGLIHESRYLPDRRDLNRMFPGSPKGSLAGRLADLFMHEIVMRSTHGIDLHTGAIHRSNLPQIRANLDDEETEKLARCFGVPVAINSSLRDGSLRAAAADLGIPLLLYEAGEALRHNELAIRAGATGVIRVMRELGMLPATKTRSKQREPFIARNSSWVRAEKSGILRAKAGLGSTVKKGDVLGHIHDLYSDRSALVRASVDGVVIGRLEKPLVYEGDGMFHIARFNTRISEVAEELETFQSDYVGDDVPGILE